MVAEEAVALEAVQQLLEQMMMEAVVVFQSLILLKIQMVVVMKEYCKQIFQQILKKPLLQKMMVASFH